jgi:hypothetical protein
MILSLIRFISVNLVDASHLSGWSSFFPGIVEVLVESLLKVGWVQLLVMQPEADVQEE